MEEDISLKQVAGTLLTPHLLQEVDIFLRSFLPRCAPPFHDLLFLNGELHGSEIL